MTTQDSNYEAQQIAAELQAALLSPGTLLKIQELRAQTILDMCDIEIVGSEVDITTAIGNHHLLKGRKQAFEELIENHETALAQVATV